MSNGVRVRLIKALIIMSAIWLWLLHLSLLPNPWPTPTNLDDCTPIGVEAAGFIPRHPAYMGDSSGHLLVACPDGVLRLPIKEE